MPNRPSMLPPSATTASSGELDGSTHRSHNVRFVRLSDVLADRLADGHVAELKLSYHTTPASATSSEHTTSNSTSAHSSTTGGVPMGAWSASDAPLLPDSHLHIDGITEDSLPDGGKRMTLLVFEDSATTTPTAADASASPQSLVKLIPDGGGGGGGGGISRVEEEKYSLSLGSEPASTTPTVVRTPLTGDSPLTARHDEKAHTTSDSPHPTFVSFASASANERALSSSSTALIFSSTSRGSAMSSVTSVSDPSWFTTLAEASDSSIALLTFRSSSLSGELGSSVLAISNSVLEGLHDSHVTPVMSRQKSETGSLNTTVLGFREEESGEEPETTIVVTPERKHTLQPASSLESPTGKQPEPEIPLQPPPAPPPAPVAETTTTTTTSTATTTTATTTAPKVPIGVPPIYTRPTHRGDNTLPSYSDGTASSSSSSVPPQPQPRRTPRSANVSCPYVLPFRKPVSPKS